MTDQEPSALRGLRWGVPAGIALWCVLTALAWWLCSRCSAPPAACPLPDADVAIVAAADAWHDLGCPLDGCELASLHAYQAPDDDAFAALCMAEAITYCTGQYRCAYAYLVTAHLRRT